MSTPESDYDIFVSYSRDEFEWVKAQVYERLMRCEFKETGRRPRIFFDRDRKDGVGIGMNWKRVIARAIKDSPRVIAVYSPGYFSSKVCAFELNLAQYFDIDGERGKLNPILYLRRGQEPDSVVTQIPVEYSTLNYIPVTEADWFERLSDALGLVPEAERGIVRFLDSPPATIGVNHTLPALRVAITSPEGDRVLARDDLLTIVAEGCPLQGTLSAKAERGVARFDDLSVGAPAASTALVAAAAGFEPARSTTFAVVPPTPPPPPPPDAPPPQIPCPGGEAIFFENEKALLVVQDGAIRVFDRDGRSLLPEGQLPLTWPVRLVRRAGPLLALAGWDGSILLLGDDGSSRSWLLGRTGAGPVIPGDLVIDGPRVLVGLWSGAVWSLAPGAEPERVLKHDPGVQALGLAGGQFQVVGLDGKLWQYRGSERTNAQMLEPTIRLLKVYPQGLLAIGDEKMYHVQLAPYQVFAEALPIRGISAVLGDVDMPVVVNGEGVGAFVTSDLVLRSSFRTTPGAVPVSADRAGRHCVLRNPDGTRTLLQQGRIVYSHLDGTLAVAPSGGGFAVGEPRGIRLHDARSFAGFVAGGPP